MSAAGIRPAVAAALTALALALALLVPLATAAPPPSTPAVTTPYFSLGLTPGEEPARSTVTLQIFLLMTVLSLVPAILIMVTSFTRILIVLSLLRRALGTSSCPATRS